VRHVSRGGTYLRIAEHSWEDPLSPAYSRERGGRWNPPGSFGVLYLNRTIELARAQVRHKLEPRGIRPEDLDPAAGPSLIETEVPEERFVDAVSEAGLISLGLPASYPFSAESSEEIPHSICQPIGVEARNADEPGIACRSAAAPDLEELALFDRGSRLKPTNTERFGNWY
jgi:hypothetical protein